MKAFNYFTSWIIISDFSWPQPLHSPTLIAHPSISGWDYINMKSCQSIAVHVSTEYCFSILEHQSILQLITLPHHRQGNMPSCARFDKYESQMVTVHLCLRDLSHVHLVQQQACLLSEGFSSPRVTKRNCVSHWLNIKMGGVSLLPYIGQKMEDKYPGYRGDRGFEPRCRGHVDTSDQISEEQASWGNRQYFGAPGAYIGLYFIVCIRLPYKTMTHFFAFWSSCTKTCTVSVSPLC